MGVATARISRHRVKDKLHHAILEIVQVMNRSFVKNRIVKMDG
jgi:hypothetical protein